MLSLKGHCEIRIQTSAVRIKVNVGVAGPGIDLTRLAPDAAIVRRAATALRVYYLDDAARSVK